MARRNRMVARAIRRPTPPLPGNVFYGKVVGGKVVGGEVGDIVTAVVLGEIVATDDVDDELNYVLKVPYEYGGFYRHRVMLQEPYYGGMLGDVVEFYIEDVLVGEAPFKSWELTHLDLDMEYTTTSTTVPPSNE
jgi:hypothetical protein